MIVAPAGVGRSDISVKLSLALSLVLCAVFPVVGFTAFLFLIGCYVDRENWRTALNATALIFVLACINAQKEPIGDWQWYTQHYAWFTNMRLSTYLGSTYTYIEIKTTEPAYYAQDRA
jgi:hypothetical protein